MADDLQFKRFQVNDCILRLTEKNLSIPVARFDLSFSLDEIPQAQVVPAFGRPLMGNAGEWATLRDIQDRDAVDLILKVNGEQTLMLRGYISQIVCNDNSSMFARRQSVRFTVIHQAVKLAGAPSVGFVFSGAAGGNLTTLNYKRSRLQMFKTLAGGGKSVYAVANAVDELTEGATNLGFFPGHVIKKFTTQVFGEFNDRQMSQDDLEEMIKTYNPANLSNAMPEPSDFLRHLAEKYSSSWYSQNAWQALTSVANEVFLHIIPFNTGFYIANPYTLNRNPTRILKAREYAKVGQQLYARLQEPRDGIILLPPGTAVGESLHDSWAFPEIIEEGKHLLNKYYHYRHFPAWINPVRDWQNAALGSGAFSPIPLENKDFPQEAASLHEYLQNVGGTLARAFYGKIKQDQRSSTLVLPYRRDLMPGTIVQIDDSDLGINFIGDTLYGMVKTTHIVCDAMGENPTLETTLEVTALRNAEDNMDDKLTFDGCPLYEEQWVGIDIEGTLLKNHPLGPKAKVPGKLPDKWFAPGLGEKGDAQDKDALAKVDDHTQSLLDEDKEAARLAELAHLRARVRP